MFLRGERLFVRDLDSTNGTFIGDVRATYGANLPFIIARLSSGQTNLNATYLNQVRAAQAFDWAVSALRTRRVDVRPLISAQLPMSRAKEAFELALDRSRSTKVQLVAD